METLKNSSPFEGDDIQEPFGPEWGVGQSMDELKTFSYISGTEAYESTHRDPPVTDFGDTTEDEE
jgi:hypothetical protein